MKKKPQNTQDHQQRVKTPDSTTFKKKPSKLKKTTEKVNNPNQISSNLQKKPNLKQSITSTTRNELKQSINSGNKIETRQSQKIKFTVNKGKKEDPKVSSNNKDLTKEERPKSVTKKSFKKQNAKKEDKKNNNNIIEKKNTEPIMNKTGDNFYKKKLIITKKNTNMTNFNTISINNNNNVDLHRKKSVDIIINKKNKKPDKLNADKNNKSFLKNEPKKSIKQIINKTPDNRKIRNHKKSNKNGKEIEKAGKNIGTIPVAKIAENSKIVEKINEKPKNEIKNKDEINKVEDKKETIKKNNEVVKNKNEVIEKKEENKIIEKKEEKKIIEEKKEILKEEVKLKINKDKNEQKIISPLEEKKDLKKEEIKEKKEEKKIEKKEISNEDKKESKKTMRYIFMRSNKFSSNNKECLYLGLNSGFFNPVQKLHLMLNSKELYNNLDKNKLILELIEYYNKLSNKNIKNKGGLEYDIETINKPFKPSERSLNSLNFIDKEEENKLMNEIQHPYIIEYFKLILTLLKEKNDENKNIFEFFFKDLLQKYKAKNFKNLFIKNFVNNEIIINDEQFNSIQKMILVKPDLLSPATLLRYNRSVAYSSFFLRDLYNYLNLKTKDGKYYYKLRENLPKNEYQEKIDKLKILII